ncbi:MAG: hypothetical protein ABFS21_12775 [Actinomycetota bacterium]
MGKSEKSFTRNQRIVLSGAIWLVIGPLIIGFLFMSWVFGLLMLAIAAWTTWDYIRRGGMADHVVRGMSQEGRIADGAVEHYGYEDKD